MYVRRNLLLWFLPHWLWILPWCEITIVTAWNVTELDCHMRKLALKFAKKIQPWRTISVYREIHDALRIQELCHEYLLKSELADHHDALLDSSFMSSTSSFCQGETCVFVNPNTTNVKQDGKVLSPVKTIDDALILTRSRKESSIIVLRHGIHTIKKTIHFDSRDDGLKLIRYPGEEVP
jgi:hypothetical protein